MKYRPFLFLLLFVLMVVVYRPVGASPALKKAAGTTFIIELDPPPHNKGGLIHWLIEREGYIESWPLWDIFTSPLSNPLPNQFAAKQHRITADGFESWRERHIELGEWLVRVWEEGADPNQVCLALQRYGWQLEDEDWRLQPFYYVQQPYEQWHGLDMDGDGRDEWLVEVCLLGYEHGTCSGQNYWLINQDGLTRWNGLNSREDLFALSTPDGFTSFVDDGDMTGDGWPEVVLESKSCGSGGCTSFFQILSGQSGTIHHLASSLQMTYATAALEDQTGDGLLDLVAHGEPFGGYMVGPRRGLTAVWTWNGEGIAEALFEQDPSIYRVHLLYEANDAFSQQDDTTAESLYLRVITDGSLKDTAIYWGDPKRLSDYDDIRRFAAFRLILLYLRQANSGEADVWGEWLLDNYPDAPITAAAEQLLSEWETTQDLVAACSLIRNQFADDHITGRLHFMGYGNPSLDSSDLCPID
jgi:hypothetical protein